MFYKPSSSVVSLLWTFSSASYFSLDHRIGSYKSEKRIFWVYHFLNQNPCLLPKNPYSISNIKRLQLKPVYFATVTDVSCGTCYLACNENPRGFSTAGSVNLRENEWIMLYEKNQSVKRMAKVQNALNRPFTPWKRRLNMNNERNDFIVAQT